VQFLTSSSFEADSELEPGPDSDIDPDPTLNSDPLPYRIRTGAGSGMILQGRSGRIQIRIRRTKHSESTTVKKNMPNNCKWHTGSTSVADPDPISGIRCLFDPWIRDPGWVESQHPDPGSGMNNPDPIFLSLKNIFFVFLGLKYLNSLMRIGIRDGDSSDPGSWMEKSRIRDPG
jgi:hypothetical protein